MHPERWRQIDELLQSALRLPSDERTQFLRQACNGDAALEHEVHSLLISQREIDGFLDRPAFEVAAEQMASGERAQLRVFDAQPGQSIGPYRLIEPLGSGGMGEVWRAEQSEPIRRIVALKLIKAGMDTRAVVARFDSERQALATMDHPNIAKVFDAGATLAGRPFFVMELVPGVPITSYCDERRLTIQQRMLLFLQVCDGVQHAHQKAFIHRDLKPSNILVEEVDGKPLPKIIDFGLAKAITHDGARSMFTEAGMMVGTPAYMSPEQAGGLDATIDTRTDVYSLGVILFELLVGAPPFASDGPRGSGAEAMLRRIRETEAPRPSVKFAAFGSTSQDVASARGETAASLLRHLRGDLDWITLRAIEKDRSRRYGTPSELAADIHRYLRNEPVTAGPASVSYRVQKYVRRNRYTVAGAAVLVVLLLAFALVQGVQLRKTRRERDRADRIAEFMTGIFKVSDPTERVGSTVTAQEILDKSAEQISAGLARDPELQSRLMHVMGQAYLNLGLQQQAQSLLEQSIKISSAALGSDNPAMLSTMRDLAWSLYEQGRLSEAETVQRKALEMQQRVLGADKPETLSSAGNLAVILDEEGNHVEGQRLAREVMEKKKRILGPESPETIAAMDNLAVILSNGGRQRLEEAENLEQQTVDIQLRLYGRENLGTINSMMNVAAMEMDLGRTEESEKKFRELLELEQRVLGPNQPETAITIYNLAELAALRGQADQALSLLGQALDHGLHLRGALKIEKDPDFNSLHSDPRFAALVASIRQRASQSQTQNQP